MKHSLHSATSYWGMAIGLFLISCGSSEEGAENNTSIVADSVAATAAYVPDDPGSIGPVQITEVAVYDQEGSPYKLSLSENSSAVVLATWCPYSKLLVNMLNDPSVASKVAELDLVFLVEKNEWPIVLRKLEEEESYTSDEKEQARQTIARKMQEQSPYHVFEAALIDNLPGQVYFYDSLSNISLEGVPSGYSGSGKDFSTNYAQWAASKLGLAKEEFMELYARYEPANESNVASK